MADPTCPLPVLARPFTTCRRKYSERSSSFVVVVIRRIVSSFTIASMEMYGNSVEFRLPCLLLVQVGVF